MSFNAKKMKKTHGKNAKVHFISSKEKTHSFKIRDTGKLALIARKQTIQIFRDKFYPTYKDMPLQQRVKG